MTHWPTWACAGVQLVDNMRFTLDLGPLLSMPLIVQTPRGSSMACMPPDSTKSSALFHSIQQKYTMQNLECSRPDSLLELQLKCSKAAYSAAIE